MSKKKVQFITIERLKNGFLIVCPQLSQGGDYKECKHTLNGVLKFMEDAWGISKIEDKNRKITNQTLVFETKKRTKPRVFKNADQSTDKN